MIIANIKSKLKSILSNNEKIGEESYSTTVLSQAEIDYMLEKLDELQNNN